VDTQDRLGVRVGAVSVSKISRNSFNQKRQGCGRWSGLTEELTSNRKTERAEGLEFPAPVLGSSALR
jgi:hypothetical protein